MIGELIEQILPIALGHVTQTRSHGSEAGLAVIGRRDSSIRQNVPALQNLWKVVIKNVGSHSAADEIGLPIATRLYRDCESIPSQPSLYELQRPHAGRLNSVPLYLHESTPVSTLLACFRDLSPQRRGAGTGSHTDLQAPTLVHARTGNRTWNTMFSSCHTGGIRVGFLELCCRV